MYGLQYITDNYGIIEIGKTPIILADIISLDSDSPSDKILYPNLNGFTLSHVRSYNYKTDTGPDDLLHSVFSGVESDGTPYIEYFKRSSIAKASDIYVFASGSIDSLPDTRGVIVKNQQGDVVITEETKNMAYFGEAYYYNAETSMGAADFLWDDFRFAWEFEFRIEGLDERPPIVFIEPAGVSNEHFTLFAQSHLGNGLWSFVLEHHNANASDSNPGPAPSVHVFAEYDFFTKPTHGLEVYRPNGQIAFHSGNANPLQIEAEDTILPPASFDNSVSVNFPSAQRPAYLFTGHTIRKEGVSVNDGGVDFGTVNYHISSIKPTSYGVLCEPIAFIESFGSNGPVRNRDETAVIFIDLNDYIN